MSQQRDPDFGFDEECEAAWRAYLAHFWAHVYPMFEEYGFSRYEALTTWFVNRLRNALPDDDAGNEPWRAE